MTMRIHKIMLLSTAIFVAGCTIGQNAAHYAVASHPSGVTLALTANGKRIVAELLEVRDDGLVVLGSNGIVALAPYKSLDLVEAKALGADYKFGYHMPPNAATKANLVKVSHFPQGMSPEIRLRFLASKGQVEMALIQ